ncbi:hypothetical protein [Magnetospirillum molischianum]|uniref:Uncharacterized protein n=1 Tax=Magnetospirillum molischianum DSM 120 TaxID=1150626 RepID=H8FXT5_MAGML|nr:hypothetical protein [Magnetospirillum molischianum]CCG43173.1 hypothetical protein PHAMO_580079 [Magnetospirillum molischianum DSM 120]
MKSPIRYRLSDADKDALLLEQAALIERQAAREQLRYSSSLTGNHAALFAGWVHDNNGNVVGMKILDQFGPRNGANSRSGRGAAINTISLEKARDYAIITR